MRGFPILIRGILSSLPKITPEQLTEYLSKLCTDGGDTGPLLNTGEQKPWPGKRERRHLHKADFPMQVRLMISNLIYVDKQGFS